MNVSTACSCVDVCVSVSACARLCVHSTVPTEQTFLASGPQAPWLGGHFLLGADLDHELVCVKGDRLFIQCVPTKQTKR